MTNEALFIFLTCPCVVLIMSLPFVILGTQPLLICILHVTGVHHSPWEGVGLRPVPAQGAVPVHARAAVRQDVHDAGRPRGGAGVLWPNHHGSPGRPEEGHPVSLRPGTEPSRPLAVGSSLVPSLGN